MSPALTAKSIEHVKPGERRREIPDPAQRGLYLIVQTSGARSFAVRYRFAGKPKKLTLQAGISLAAARKATADALFEVSQGRDPSAVKARQRDEQRAAAADTFEAVCDNFFRRDGARLRSAGDWQRHLKRQVFPAFGTRPICEIRRKDIVNLLDTIEDERGPGSATNTLAIIRMVMNWYAARSDDFRSPIVRGMARRKTSENARKRILNDDEIRAVWKADMEGPFPSLVKFLLLTAARRNEARDITQSEVHGATWELPGRRNKTKADLMRPLSAIALSVLTKVPRIIGSELFFTIDGRRLGGLARRKAEFDKACSVTGWTLHDLRRTARSLMSRAGVPSEHAERCLGHIIGGVEGTYDRYDYRQEMLLAYEKLAMLVEQIVDPQPNVVALVRS
jgi:integrase